MVLTRVPGPPLRPFVRFLWASDQAGEGRSVPVRREHVLPTGETHLALRLADDPLRLFDAPDDATGRVIGRAVVGGARRSFYIREVSKPLCSVGAQLLPGATDALFGVPANELAERHTPLEDLWGGVCVAAMRGRLAELGSLEDRLDAFEAMLTARLPRARALHPAVARAFAQLRMTANVHEVVSRSGYSHRMFISLFSRSVGLTPKAYSRVLRFRRALRHAVAPPGVPWIDVAIAAGYSDQSHFVREFREFTGVTPTVYRQASPAFPHHLPVASNRR
jgi:AraC-like DNA-binding protein